MTPQEQQLLEGLIQRVEQTQLPEKDQEAEQLLRQSLGQNPDALYILCQTVLVQQYALEQAQKKIESLQQAPPPQQQNPEHHTSFLGNLFGGAQHQAAPPPPQPQYEPVNYGAPQPPYGQPYGQPYGGGYGAPQYAPAPPMGGGFGGGGFLQGAMQTAAGVAAGELAFRGIEDLMHGFGHEAGYGSDRGLGSNFGERPEVINNNYYGDDHTPGLGGDHDGSLSDRLRAADGGSGLSPDIEDRRQGFADTSSPDLDAQDDSTQDDFADSGFDSDAGDDSDDSGDFSSNDDSGF
ncbi:DUF2076 domain-containing protein [Granulicella sp. WH15]|uniref:DUF2076 domain-containing protein n=1 Tax=Granulicella sp. WH15 TaxID=2602070 RepID=UPI0013677CB5|nr:DUF2076 domain-containing protein [Granulicella sp. WH15]QHN04608.1 DUF2076 domain-containing protein [Granulicella sp. WH15]